jgi:hypothetical protein
MADANQESVTAFRRPFVCHSDTKVALKTTRTIEMDLGQHSVVPEVEGANHEFEIFHVPLRYRSEIVKRGMNFEPRRAATRTDPGQSWQSAFHRQVVIEDRVDEVWRANSVDAGADQVFLRGEQLQLVRDLRLRRLLLRASAYLGLAFRTLAI